MARGEKPRYDGRWRPENAPGKTPPAGVAPVMRFRNPRRRRRRVGRRRQGPHRDSPTPSSTTSCIARPDGTPTYNFCVVVDDIDMRITHVIRGDDHVNNTPRQINIFRALGAEPPAYAHVPTVLGEDGAKLSKRHGAVGVMEYEAQGYLPEAMVNFLARMGWAHGDDEVFTRASSSNGSTCRASARRRRASMPTSCVAQPGAHEALARGAPRPPYLTP